MITDHEMLSRISFFKSTTWIDFKICGETNSFKERRKLIWSSWKLLKHKVQDNELHYLNRVILLLNKSTF